MIYLSFTNWQENQVITTVKTLTKPVAELDFPAVTICGGGKYMDLVEKVLYNNFKTWNEKRTKPNNTINDDFAEYMKDIFQIQDKSLNILDILKMVVANDESS